MFGLLWLTAMVGVSLGLLVSAAARSSETAIALVPLLLLPMVILGGMMRKLHEMPDLVRGLAHLMPSRWAFEGLLSLEDSLAAEAMFQPRSPLAGVFVVCTVMLAILVSAIALQLRLRDIHGPFRPRRMQ
jgi:ABC-2 type transport system permease protein